MKATRSQLEQMQPLDKVIIHSLDLALYQASVISQSQEFYLADEQGRLIRSRCTLDMQGHFRGLEFKQMVLRHQSAYDEMLGMPERTDSNALEVPLAMSELAVH